MKKITFTIVLHILALTLMFNNHIVAEQPSQAREIGIQVLKEFAKIEATFFAITGLTLVLTCGIATYISVKKQIKELGNVQADFEQPGAMENSNFKKLYWKTYCNFLRFIFTKVKWYEILCYNLVFLSSIMPAYMPVPMSLYNPFFMPTYVSPPPYIPPAPVYTPIFVPNLPPPVFYYYH